MRKYSFLLSLLLVAACSLYSNAQPGANDASFITGTGPNLFVYATAIQTDGKIIIAGDFTSYNGTLINRIARLNANGTIDSGFNPGTGANDVVETIAIQSDGKIIIGGWFTLYNGTARNRIARLNANGSLDGAFNPGTGPNNAIYTSAIQSDGKILIGGELRSYNGTISNYITRLNSDGSLDGGFTGSGANATVRAIAIQNDSKIIIGGSFSSYNGTLRGRIARLNANGTIDDTFDPGTETNGWIYSIAIQSDGKIIIGGDFTSFKGTVANRIARLNADGTFDNGFNPGTGANDAVETIAIQSDGKIIIGGKFTSYNTTSRNRIARLNADGTLDSDFNPGTGANFSVRTSAIQTDGKIIVGGFFTLYNGIDKNRLARIEGGISTDIKTNGSNSISQIFISPNPGNGVFTIEANNIIPTKRTVKVFNILGKVVYDSTFNDLQLAIDLSREAKGMYIVQVLTEQGTSQHKIVKQ